MSKILSGIDGAMIRRYYASGHWSSETIYGSAVKLRDRDPSAVALREQGGHLSRVDLISAADLLASTLHARGLRPGDRVAVWLPSRAETAVALLACSRNGYVICPSLHRDHSVGEVTALLGRMRASAVIHEIGYGADADRVDLRSQLDAVPSIRWVGSLAPRGRDVTDSPADVVLLAQLRPHLSTDAEPPSVVADPDHVSYLAFTSGTTGEPKGVMHTENTVAAATRAMAQDWGFSDSSVVYSFSPLSHNLGFGALVLALTTGGQFVIHDLPRGHSIARRLLETRATFAFGVPTHAIDLLAELDADTNMELPELRGFRISGAALPATVAAALIARGIIPQSGYGMTEGGSHHYTRPDDDARTIIETSGRPFDGHVTRIVSLTDPEKEVSVGEIGQITNEGPSVTVGYFDDQERTEEAFNRFGWLLTGDLGHVDERGNIRITGRKKELIIRGGHNIHPARVERLATAHPGIEQAAAIPVPDHRLGERVGLVMKLASGQEISDAELFQHLEYGGLSRYDMPEYLAVVADLPLTASGKIAKLEIIARLAAGDLPLREVRYRPTSAGGPAERSV